MSNYGLEKIISQVRRDQNHKSPRVRYDFELADNTLEISGDHNHLVEVVEYQFPIIYGFKGGSGRRGYDNDDFGGDEILGNKYRKKTVNRIGKRIFKLAKDNFARGDRFCTLVHADQVLDLQKSNKYFKDFIKRLQYNENNGRPFKYLAGIEFKQKNRECIHYHVLWDLPYIPQKKLLFYWGRGRGSVFIRRIYQVTNLGAYLLKYIGKGLSDSRFEGQNSYLCSRGLKRRKKVYLTGDEFEEVKKKLGLTDNKIAYRKSCDTDYQGWRKETHYDLERNMRKKGGEK